MARCKPVPHRIMTTNSVMGRVRLPLAAHSLCLCEFCVESITVAGRGSRYSLSLMLLLSTNSDSTSRNRAHDRSGMVTAVRKLLRTCHRKKSTHCTMLCNTQSKILQGCTPVLHFKHLLLQFLKFGILYSWLPQSGHFPMGILGSLYMKKASCTTPSQINYSSRGEFVQYFSSVQCFSPQPCLPHPKDKKLGPSL